MLNDQNRIDIVRYRIENANRTLAEVQLHIDNKLYNTAMSRMYYACYYAVSALLVANKITTKSHDGVKQMFGLHFVKTGIFPPHLGRYYGNLFDKRLTGDYEDNFDHDESTVLEFYPKAKELVAAVNEKVDRWLAENATE